MTKAKVKANPNQQQQFKSGYLHAIQYSRANGLDKLRDTYTDESIKLSYSMGELFAAGFCYGVDDIYQSNAHITGGCVQDAYDAFFA